MADGHVRRFGNSQQNKNKNDPLECSVKSAFQRVFHCKKDNCIFNMEIEEYVFIYETSYNKIMTD